MLLAVINACLLLAAAAWLWSRVHFKSSTAVPVVPGLPLLGSVIALGRGGTAFLSQCRQQVRECGHISQQPFNFPCTCLNYVISCSRWCDLGLCLNAATAASLPSRRINIINYVACIPSHEIASLSRVMSSRSKCGTACSCPNCC